MSKRADNENVSPDTDMKKRCTDSKPGGSSVDTECQDENPEAMIGDTSMDTESLWEVQYSYEGEDNLHQYYDNCTKNPGHENFIPVDKFRMENLPEDYRHKDFFDFIQAESDLTVRLTVTYISKKRPKTDDVSGKPYPGYRNRGKRRMVVGTGWVNKVHVVNDRRHGFCQCKDCQNSSTPQTSFSQIEICTATHVVYDDSEGEHTMCHLFFDRGDKPQTCRGVVTLSGLYTYFNDTGSDHCSMLHFTHDLKLGNRLHQRCQQRDELRNKVFTKPQHTWNFKRRRPAPDKQPLLFIVSHPHGCSKQISLGRWTSAHSLYRNMHSYRYTAATCPGSSGARVYLPQRFPSSDEEIELYAVYESHAGLYGKQPGTNFCFSDTRVQMFEYVSLEFLQLDGGPLEDNFWCIDEEDLHTHYHICQRNPGHQNFFPVDNFSLDNLPLFYRKNDIMKLIKTMSDLTVRVSVRYVSEERPETVPGTDIPYPWYRNRGSNQLRVGSGCVTRVELFEEGECQCEECESSGSAKEGCAHVIIRTGAHLVYNEHEVEHTTCHLFFDSGESPDVCSGAMALRGLWSEEHEPEKDAIELVYMTHDLEFAGRFSSLIDNYWQLLEDCNEFSDVFSRKKHGIDNPCPEPPLHIVVSHPHGCAKHVSIGYCGSHGNTNTEENQCPYNSITCPGSSGAPVVALGWETLYPCYE
ncbi:hypothetical protein BsWGS_27094 [Bradybaena similaris]